MHFSTILSTAAVLAVARAHSVIQNAQGLDGSPASVGFQVDPSLPRNCTGISPCQQDATLIRDAEIASNIVGQCGRTEIAGSINVTANTEQAIADGAVTQVAAGGTMTVTIHQVNADGAGPYSCDLDEASDSGVISHNLTVTNNVPGTNGLSLAKEEDFNITVTMPTDLNCSGGSTGNICTVRCRNNAVAGPFGGCFAVQQADAAGSAGSAAAAAAAAASSAASASTSAASAASSTAAAATTGKGRGKGAKGNKGNNANNKRSALRWAKRIEDDE